MTRFGSAARGVPSAPTDSVPVVDERDATAASQPGDRVMALYRDRRLRVVWRLNPQTGRPEMRWELDRTSH